MLLQPFARFSWLIWAASLIFNSLDESCCWAAETARGRVLNDDIDIAAFAKLWYPDNADDGIERDYIVLFNKTLITGIETVTSTVSKLNTTDVNPLELFDEMKMAKVTVQVDSSTVEKSDIKLEIEQKLLPWLRNDLVQLIEQDQIVRFAQSDDVKMAGDQDFPPWGLDRIDQTELPLNNQYHFDMNGEGVTAYVIDTGIRETHDEFGGRAICAVSLIEGESCDDRNGHGTHVAGIVGAATFGVAKGVNLVGVKVLSNEGSGPNSGVVAGIEWVLAQALTSLERPRVANLSLGGFRSRALDFAVRELVQEGRVFTAVAAGNDSEDACLSSPASAELVISVGATTEEDFRSSFSNFGQCVDIFAPGSDIKSTWVDSDTSTNSISGTSMASPHVAGAAALFLSANPLQLPNTVKAWLIEGAIEEKLFDIGERSPNRLLNTENLFTTTPGSPPESGEYIQRTVRLTQVLTIILACIL